QDSAQRPVDSHPAAVGSHERHADGRELERAAEPLLALAQSGFHRLLLCVDVDAHADEKPLSTVTGTRGDFAALMNPAPLTVPSANSILDGVAMSLNSECRQGGGKLYEVYLVRRRRSPLAVIKRQRAEQSAGIINDRHRPAGPEAVRQRDRRIFGPKVGLLNILDNDHLATGRSGSTRALRDADRHGIDRARVSIWKARSRAGSQQPA